MLAGAMNTDSVTLVGSHCHLMSSQTVGRRGQFELNLILHAQVVCLMLEQQ